jgi:hypothetical protein
MDWLAAVLSLSLFVAIAWLVARLKEPPSIAFVGLIVFGAVPILVLLKSEIAAYAVETPQGRFGVKLSQLENKVEVVQTRTQNIGATVSAVAEGKSTASPQSKGVKPGTRIRITDIDARDSFYKYREELVGKTAIAGQLDTWDDGWSYGSADASPPLATFPGSFVFHRFKYEPVK